jgi:proline iminopeptidase
VGGSKRIKIGGGHWVWRKKVGSGDIKCSSPAWWSGADHRYLRGSKTFYHAMILSSITMTWIQPTPKNPTIRAYGRSHGTPMKWKQFAKVSVWINSICWDTQGAGLLAIEYALKYQEHLKGLVISNMAASADSFVKHVSKLRAQFPADVRAKLEFYENADKTDDPAYQRLLFDKVYKIFICRDL